MSASYVVVLFFTSNHAFRAAKIAQQLAVEHRLVPVPRQLSSDCGVCLRLPAESVAAVLPELRAAHVVYDRVEPLA